MSVRELLRAAGSVFAARIFSRGVVAPVTSMRPTQQSRAAQAILAQAILAKERNPKCDYHALWKIACAIAPSTM
eukprot:9488794-Pyramimonas_sp.AAC.1